MECDHIIGMADGVGGEKWLVYSSAGDKDKEFMQYGERFTFCPKCGTILVKQ